MEKILHWAMIGQHYTLCGKGFYGQRVQRCTPKEAIRAVYSTADTCSECQEYAPLRVIDMKES